MKKAAAIILTAIMSISFCACSNSEANTTTESTAIATTVEETTETTAQSTTETTTQTTTEATTETTTEKPTTTEKKTTTTKKETTTKKKSDKQIAKGYVGKSLDSLKKKIGNANSSEKAESCYYEGEKDGIFYYDDFTVTAHTENGKWIIDSID